MLDQELETGLQVVLSHDVGLLVEVHRHQPSLRESLRPRLTHCEAQWAEIQITQLTQVALVLSLCEVDTDRGRLRLHVVLQCRENQDQLANKATNRVDLQVVRVCLLVGDSIPYVKDLASVLRTELSPGSLVNHFGHDCVQQIVQSLALS